LFALNHLFVPTNGFPCFTLKRHNCCLSCFNPLVYVCDKIIADAVINILCCLSVILGFDVVLIKLSAVRKFQATQWVSDEVYAIPRIYRVWVKVSEFVCQIGQIVIILIAGCGVSELLVSRGYEIKTSIFNPSSLSISMFPLKHVLPVLWK
jgi:hypothetical protein